MSKKSKVSAHQARMARVREAFSAEDLIRICAQTDFSDYAHKVEVPTRQTAWYGETPEGFFYYKDNGASILAVAHLDSVQTDNSCTVVDTGAGPLALSGVLDDRLGVYVILELLPKLGIEVDWLLTTNEEMGASTAANFYPEHKKYNWMIEFDRMGTDVVMYQYETQELEDLVRRAGAEVRSGSYSDIADLDQLGCAGFNWGVGYHDYHTMRGLAWLEDTFKMVARFMRFYAANAATHLPYDRMASKYDIIDPCPECTSQLDRWGCCRACGYSWFHDHDDKEIEVIDSDSASGVDEQSADQDQRASVDSSGVSAG